MNTAQAAWALLTTSFLAAATVLLIFAENATPAAIVCLVVAVLGWLLLGGMITSDRKVVPVPE